VLENSGVAEPQNIRDKFSEAIAEGHPLMHRIFLDTLVTVVDAGAARASSHAVPGFGSCTASSSTCSSLSWTPVRCFLCHMLGAWHARRLLRPCGAPYPP
jgi:hypothetical protein